ncbi:hypothetical protein L0F63_006045 [Massospora cicadina]|nr:hypothetical protein L0F63_006045 [Massospora cicadina]
MSKPASPRPEEPSATANQATVPLPSSASPEVLNRIASVKGKLIATTKLIKMYHTKNFENQELLRSLESVQHRSQTILQAYQGVLKDRETLTKACADVTEKYNQLYDRSTRFINREVFEENSKLSIKVASLEKVNEQLECQIFQFRTKGENSEELERANAKLRKSLDSLTKKCADQEALVKSKVEQLRKLDQENKKFKQAGAELKQLQAQRDEAQSSRDHFRQELAQLCEYIDGLGPDPEGPEAASLLLARPAIAKLERVLESLKGADIDALVTNHRAELEALNSKNFEAIRALEDSLQRKLETETRALKHALAQAKDQKEALLDALMNGAIPHTQDQNDIVASHKGEFIPINEDKAKTIQAMEGTQLELEENVAALKVIDKRSTLTIPADRMSLWEAKLVTFIALHTTAFPSHSILDLTLGGIAKELISDQPDFHYVRCLSHLFASLCKLARDGERLRVMLYDVLAYGSKSRHLLVCVSSMAQVWGAPLAATPGSSDLCVGVFQAILASVLPYAETQLGPGIAVRHYTQLVEKLGWQPPDRAVSLDKVLLPLLKGYEDPQSHPDFRGVLLRLIGLIRTMDLWMDTMLRWFNLVAATSGYSWGLSQRWYARVSLYQTHRRAHRLVASVGLIPGLGRLRYTYAERV